MNCTCPPRFFFSLLLLGRNNRKKPAHLRLMTLLAFLFFLLYLLTEDRTHLLFNIEEHYGYNIKQSCHLVLLVFFVMLGAFSGYALSPRKEAETQDHLFDNPT
jgi:hypothetical protein